VKIVIWGPSASGKTNLLMQVFLQPPPPDWRVQPRDRALEYLKELSSSINENAFPPPTPSGARQETNFHLINTRSNEEVTIAIQDRAGQESEKIDERSEQPLGEADGLVILFDPARTAVDPENEVQMALYAIENIRRKSAKDGVYPLADPRPAAICLSKADMLIHSAEEYELALKNPEEFIRSRVGRDVVEMSRRHFGRVRFFLTSAVGLKLRFGVAEPTTFFDENLELRIAKSEQPINVLEPFIWIFQTLREATA
jgi:hypothetical protein